MLDPLVNLLSTRNEQNEPTLRELQDLCDARIAPRNSERETPSLELPPACRTVLLKGELAAREEHKLLVC
jgi:hypothetical protein